VRVAGLWRYPVKGLLGEELTLATLDEHGVRGDRAWAVVGADGKLGSGKTTRRFRRMPGLFSMSARTIGSGAVVVTVGDWSGEVDDPETARRVSDVVGEPITLQPASAIPVRVHDEGPVHVLTTASVAWIGADVRRFRANVLLDVAGDGPVEDAWVGRDVSLGDVRLRVTQRMPRCVMTALAQDDLAFEPSLVRELERRNDSRLGICADVVRGGTIGVDGPA